MGDWRGTIQLENENKEILLSLRLSFRQSKKISLINEQSLQEIHQNISFNENSSPAILSYSQLNSKQKGHLQGLGLHMDRPVAQNRKIPRKLVHTMYIGNHDKEDRLEAAVVQCPMSSARRSATSFRGLRDSLADRTK